MTNREILEQADLIDPSAQLSQAQSDAIESLTTAEVDSLISTKGKLGPVFHNQAVTGVRFHGILE
jgi:hypothetical protein